MIEPGSPEERAYKRGVETAELQSRLADHEQHLKVVNGSIARTAEQLSKVKECLDEILGDLKTRAKVEKALADTVKTAAASQVTTRTFAIGIAMMIIAIIGLYLGARG